MTQYQMRLKMTRVAHDGPTQAPPDGQTAFSFGDEAPEQAGFDFAEPTVQPSAAGCGFCQGTGACDGCGGCGLLNDLAPCHWCAGDGACTHCNGNG